MKNVVAWTAQPKRNAGLHVRRGQQVRKTSRRDLPYVMSQRLDGATTVAATMLLAARAGISVFVTGGVQLDQSGRC